MNAVIKFYNTSFSFRTALSDWILHRNKASSFSGSDFSKFSFFRELAFEDANRMLGALHVYYFDLELLSESDYHYIYDVVCHMSNYGYFVKLKTLDSFKHSKV